MGPFISIFDANADLAELLKANLPEGDFRRVCIKPNWVKHQESEDFPIAALVTSTSLIEAVIVACRAKYANLEELTIGDVPLQSCDWELLIKQAGIVDLIEKYANSSMPRIRFLDLRRECFKLRDGFLEKDNSHTYGDPKGYKEIVLDTKSKLEAISSERDTFRVSDFTPQLTRSSHRKGYHRYLVASSVLDCDLFINMPKLKTHQKSGLTGALKNLVGINGEKGYLVHHRKGMPKSGGDEFPPDVNPLIVLQARARELVQKRNKIVFAALRRLWVIARHLSRIEVNGTPENLGKRFYTAAGSWYGNDTIWRMVYDLNDIIVFGRSEGGELSTVPQRQYITVMDAIIAGEGNGPLQPLPVPLKLVSISDNPYLMDMAMARIIGFDYAKIPMLSNFKILDDHYWRSFDPENVTIRFGTDEFIGVQSLPIIRRFLAPPGWARHVELGQ